MRRLILIAAVMVGASAALAGATERAAAAKPDAGKLTSIYLTGTLDRRDRPRVFARFDRILPAARGAMRGARVRLDVHADVVVAGTGVSEPVHEVLVRPLASLRRKGRWDLELPLRRGQAAQIRRAANVPDQLRVDGTAKQTVLPAGAEPLRPSRISGVAATAGAQFEGQEKVNGSVTAYYIVQKPECEHTREGCQSLRAEGTWSHPTWKEQRPEGENVTFENGEDNLHGDLSLTGCNGGWSGVCEGFFGGLFAATEINSISPYPEGTAFFNVSRPSSEITPEIEIAAEYNEHEPSAPPTGCRIAGYAYGSWKYAFHGPQPTCFSQQTEVESNQGEEESEGDDGEGTAFDSYVVTTVWPADSEPPSP
jgi:hypothetical protein